MPSAELKTDRPETDPQARASTLLHAHRNIAEVYRERCTGAVQRYVDALKGAGNPLSADPDRPVAARELWRDASAYWLDLSQRSVLFWDTLRQRGNNWLEHEKAGKPPLLDFEWEMVADARTFAQPANYALVRIVPPEGVRVESDRRPFVIIDPRAGHGPGIGGFKQDSQVGVALKAGHPVYFVIFFPEPIPGQSLADVSLAEAEFLRIVIARHPEARKPVLIGNCQGGWATMLIGAFEPDLVGPIVINGAPMSYWSGNDGENPMRYAGGMLGGLWPALLASDLGSGQFDGAHLVENFEYLNPANTYFDKYYNLFAKIDTEPARFLEFERWWGGFFLMDRKEIKWIVENLFVGNKLSSGEAEWSEGRAFDLRAIKSPIILFASLGDNITPPQQAFNWVADLYPTTAALKANGQVIVGLMHESVGHLGIFVSGQVAKREHAQIVDLIGYIEQLPPGLYGMQIEETRAQGKTHYDVVLTERRVEDLQQLQKYGRRDEVPFEAVEATSETLASIYETFLRPVLAPMVTPAAAQAARTLHPQRVQRWAVSDLNPFLWPLKGMAEWARATRAPRDGAGPMSALEQWAAAITSASWDLYRDLRDAAVETAFFNTYTAAGIARVASAEADVSEAGSPTQSAERVEAALARIAQGGRTEAIVRVALLLMKAGTGRRRLSAMKRIRELVGRDAGLLDLPAEAAREIIRSQSYIVEIEPEKALAALPALLGSAEDRRFVADLLERLPGRIEANQAQIGLLNDIRRLLSEGRRGDRSAGAAPRAHPASKLAQDDAASGIIDTRGHANERPSHRLGQSRH